MYFNSCENIRGIGTLMVRWFCTEKGWSRGADATGISCRGHKVQVIQPYDDIYSLCAVIDVLFGDLWGQRIRDFQECEEGLNGHPIEWKSKHISLPSVSGACLSLKLRIW